MRQSILARTCAALALGAALLSTRAALADARTEARSHFKKGMSLIAAGRYEEGISELSLTYEILPHPNVLYNIARAYAESGDLEGAIDTYKKYLEGNPSDRDDVARIIALLDARVRRQKAIAEAALRAEAPAAGPPVSPGATTPGTTVGPTTAQGAAPVASSPRADAPDAPTAPLDIGTAKTGDVFEETVITASKGAQSPLDAPNSTSIVTEQDIRLSGITKIPELLRHLAGVDVMEVTASEPELSLRGFNQRMSNKLLVLVDGRSVNLDLLGSVQWATLPIGVEDIARIEVVRGPGSALYGADAFNGIINIITKAPGEGKSGFRAGLGDQGASHAQVWATGREKDTAWRLSGGYDYLPVWSREVAPSRVDVHTLVGDQNQAERMVRLNMTATRDVASNVTLGAGAGLAYGSYDIGAPLPLNHLRYVGAQISDAIAFLRSKHVEARAFWNSQRTPNYGLNVAQIGQSLLEGYASSDVGDAEVQYVDQFETGAGIAHDLHFGLGYRYKGSQWSYQDHDRVEHHESAYLHDEIQLGSAMALVGDVRLDYVPYLAQVVPSPRGAVLVHPTKLSTIRGIVATAFRTPTFLESYLQTPIQVPITGGAFMGEDTPKDIGAPKLKPEQVFTAELGYLNQDSDLFTFDSAVFFNHVTRLIDIAPNRPVSVADLANGLAQPDPSTGLYPLSFENYENACQAYDTLGGEFGLRMFPVDGLDLYGNYTVMKVREDFNGCNAQQRALLVPDARTSAHKVNVGVQVRTLLGFDGSVDFHYVSPQTWAEQVPDLATQRIDYESFHLDAYTLLNARLGYRFLKNHAEVSGMVFNLLNDLHREHPFGETVGRRGMAYFTYQF